MSKVVINSMDRKTNNVDQWLYTVDNPDESVFIVNIFGDDINNLEVNLYTVPPEVGSSTATHPMETKRKVGCVDFVQ
jgi:hypothetical protein